MDDRSTGELSQNVFDELMMRSALKLAERGIGWVSPSPMVGAVIVGPDRQVIAEGWHERYGEAHAEVNALAHVAGADLSRATMYVTLEPCSHFGKTPPCAEALVLSGLRRVVVAMRDPNPIVSGRGNRLLREAGLEVIVGVCEAEARRQNEAYIHRMSTGLPFITIKMAQSLDGFTALPGGESRWITGETSRRRVHVMRAHNDAVMVGTRTASLDNPRLDLRYGVDGRQPLRVTIDRELTLPDTHNLLSDDLRGRTIIFTSALHAGSERARRLKGRGIRVEGLQATAEGVHLEELFRFLAEDGANSVLVEGGSGLAAALVREDLASKVVLFVAPKLLGAGFSSFPDLGVAHLADALMFTFVNVEPLGEDLMIEAYPQERTRKSGRS